MLSESTYIKRKNLKGTLILGNIDSVSVTEAPVINIIA